MIALSAVLAIALVDRPTYYVSPTSGSDAAAGTSASTAFATLHRARDAARTAAAPTRATVLLQRGAVHELRSTLLLNTRADSGTDWSMYGDAAAALPIVSGGFLIENWTVAPRPTGAVRHFFSLFMTENTSQI